MSDDESVDVAALLMSINQNLAEAENEPEPTAEEVAPIQEHFEIPKFEDAESHSPQQEITIVRAEAIHSEPPQDYILQILQNIEMQNSLLTNSEISSHHLDTSSIQQLVNEIKQKYDQQNDKIHKHQIFIFGFLVDIKELSNSILTQMKKKHIKTDWLKFIKDLKQQEIQANKAKGYIMNILERLDIIEQQIDKIIDVHVKNKLQQLQV